MSSPDTVRFPAEDRERRKWMDPEAILARIGVKQGTIFADIGCGGGFFALPAARIVGYNGRVLGVDRDVRSVNAVLESASKEKLDNLQLAAGRAEDIVLCSHCADVVFFGMDLHDFDDASAVLRNARKTIKPSGILVNLDWKKETMRFGPPLEKRFDEEKAKKLIEGAGFAVESISGSGPFHYLILATPLPANK